MVEDLTIRNEAVVTAYDVILSALARIPANETELAALREFISATPVKVALLVEEVSLFKGDGF
jgi:hypothetical protein